MSPPEPDDPAAAAAVIPYGAWPSPVTPAVVTAASVSLGGPVCDGDILWWSELRPTEGGRVQLVCKPLDAPPTAAVDLLPEGWSARTRVHEYGGGAWWVADGLVVFARWSDQRLYAVRPTAAAGPGAAAGTGVPWPLTPEPALAAGDRYADLRIVDLGGATWVLAVRERHEPDRVDGGHVEPANELVAVRVVAEGQPPEPPVVLVSGADFVSHPRLAPDGASCSWLQWDHPRMPWEGTELWAGALAIGADGLPHVVGPRRVAGGPTESIAQPAWDASSRLHLVSDRDDGWWGLYRCPSSGVPAADAAVEPVLVLSGAELAQPQWVFGQSWYCWTDGGDLVGCVRRDGRDHLLVVPAGADGPTWIAGSVTSVDGVTSTPRGAALIAADFGREPAVIELVDPARAGRGEQPVVVEHRPPRDLGIDDSWWSIPEHVAVPTVDGSDVFALVYPPTNPDVVGPAGERPPLLVLIHGGPTSAARPLLALAVQFWTSRGFCVADVNYRGSTGYGRPYRAALEGAWGIADVEDCLAVAGWLASRGTVDGDRLAIRGGSAGGFTVCNALIAGAAVADAADAAEAANGSARFAVGGCLYGVTDLEALAHDTHKFEAHYTDSLVGPWPEAADVYRERSPIHHLDRLRSPLIVFQGLEDEVVPPSQAEALVAALDAHRVPYAYLTFAGEQHGFRRAETIERVLEAELYFYGRILGFEPGGAEGVPAAAPVEVHHLG